ncbi:MAG: trehalose operon repressor [Lachnospiraceae bacterium]|nr:trehalose operon repressor [Lachnospiraceae bacterium]
MPAGKFEGIYKDLASKVTDGKYERGTFLPSENQLKEIYGCSRNTIRRALSLLASQGYVQAIHGKGVQVIYQPVKQAHFIVGGIESFTESAKRNRLHTKTKVIQFTDLTVDEHMAGRTGFQVGDEVWYIQRIRLIDQKPVILDINVFLKSETPGLTEDIASHSIYEYLENDLHMQITTSKRRITAERATEMDTQLLDLKDYDFIAAVTSQTYNSRGIMFEWTQSRHRPDYFEFYDTASRKTAAEINI